MLSKDLDKFSGKSAAALASESLTLTHGQTICRYKNGDFRYEDHTIYDGSTSTGKQQLV